LDVQKEIKSSPFYKTTQDQLTPEEVEQLKDHRIVEKEVFAEKEV
jgi:hypothetical protein